MRTGSVQRSSAILSSCKLKWWSIIVLWGKYPSFASSFCLLFVFVNDSIWQIYIYQNNDVDFVLSFIQFDEKSQTVNSFINADCRWCRYLTFLIIHGVFSCCSSVTILIIKTSLSQFRCRCQTLHRRRYQPVQNLPIPVLCSFIRYSDPHDCPIHSDGLPTRKPLY